MKCLLLSVIAFIGILSGCCEKSSEKPKTSAEKPDLSEEKRLISDEKSEEDEEIPLVRIDKKLQQELQNPTAPAVSYEVQLKILKNLVNYQNRLRALCDGVHNHTVKKLEIAHNLLRQEGPNFLKEEINEEKLKQIYNWDEESLEFFRDSINDIKSIWNDIAKALKETPTPMEIFLDKKVVT